MLTPSSMVLPLGTVAPDFFLPDASGKKHSLMEIRGREATLLFFACNHCPYVVHIQQGVRKLFQDYEPRGVGFVAINSNDVEAYPADHPSKMGAFAKGAGWSFPYLYDETQDVARSYHAACTPDFYLFDSELTLVYRGQLDDSRPGNGKPVTGESLRSALDDLLGNKPPLSPQKPSSGCNIKWKE